MDDIVDDFRTGMCTGEWSESKLEELESMMPGSDSDSEGVLSKSEDKGSEKEGSNSSLSLLSEMGIKGGRSKSLLSEEGLSTGGDKGSLCLSKAVTASNWAVEVDIYGLATEVSVTICVFDTRFAA